MGMVYGSLNLAKFTISIIKIYSQTGIIYTHYVRHVNDTFNSHVGRVLFTRFTTNFRITKYV